MVLKTIKTQYQGEGHILVLLAIVSKDEILQGHFNADPLLVSKSGPDVVGLSDSGLVRLQNHLGQQVERGGGGGGRGVGRGGGRMGRWRWRRGGGKVEEVEVEKVEERWWKGRGGGGGGEVVERWRSWRRGGHTQQVPSWMKAYCVSHMHPTTPYRHWL